MGGITGSRYFNDPQMAAAASNLAGLFAPPSGADAAGWAAANAKREEAKRLAALYDYTTAPNFDQAQFDRMGEAAGAWHPDQGYYSVDQGNQTLRSNNAADNARAIEATRLTNAKDITTSMLAPVAADATRFIPKSIADLYGTGDTQVGVAANAADNATLRANNAVDNARALETNRLSELGNLFDPLAQGATRPGVPTDIASQFGVSHGLVAEHGADIPLSDTQWTAQQNERLLRNGELTDQQLADTVLGKETPVQIQTPTGPQFASPGAAVRMGATPYDKPPAVGATETQNYKMEDGTTGTAYFDNAAKKWIDVTSGQAIPGKFVTYSAGLTGTAAETGLGKRTERDSTLDLAGENMKPGIAVLNKAFAGDQSVSTGALMMKSLFGDNPAVTDIAQRAGIINPTDQLILGGIDSVMNYLYLQTGAARTEGEDTKAYVSMVPLQSDTPEKRQFKRDMFNQKAMSIINQSKDPTVKATLMQAIKGVFVSPVGGNALDTTVPAVANTAPDAAAPAAAVAPVTAPAPVGEGTIIQNDAGQKMIRKNGAWEPYSG